MRTKPQDQMHNTTESYTAWRPQLVPGLTPTHTPLDGIEWAEEAGPLSGELTAPVIGSDLWHKAQIGARNIYRCRNAAGDTVYAPLDIVHGWYDAMYDEMVERLGASHAAQIMLEVSLYLEDLEYYSQHQLPFRDKLREYILVARQSEWLIGDVPRDERYPVGSIRAAQRYGVPYVMMRHLAWGNNMDITRHSPAGHYIKAFYSHPGNGQIYVQVLSGRWYEGTEMLQRIESARQAEADGYQAGVEMVGLI